MLRVSERPDAGLRGLTDDGEREIFLELLRGGERDGVALLAFQEVGGLPEPQYDLRHFITTGDPFIDQLVEQFNLVLDKMIAVRPEDRIPIKQVLQKVQRAERLWTLEYALPTSHVGGALCRYCGQGNYKKCKDSPVNFGIEQRGKSDLTILVCNCCGHVELFRPDHIDLFPL